MGSCGCGPHRLPGTFPCPSLHRLVGLSPCCSPKSWPPPTHRSPAPCWPQATLQSPGHLVTWSFWLMVSPPPPSPAIWVLLAAPLCPSHCVCLTHGPLPPPCTLLTFALLSLGVSLTSHTHLCHSLPLLRWSICLSVCPSLLFLFSLPVPLPPQDDSWILERQHPPPPSWPQTSPLLPTQSPRAALSFPTSCQHLSPTFC